MTSGHFSPGRIKTGILPLEDGSMSSFGLYFQGPLLAVKMQVLEAGSILRVIPRIE